MMYLPPEVLHTLRSLVADLKITDILVALFTVVLGIVAVYQYLLVKQQDEHFQNVERAWVLIELGRDGNAPKVRVLSSMVVDKLAVETTIRTSVSLRNEGKSPAFIDSIKIKTIPVETLVESDLPKETEFELCEKMAPIGAGKTRMDFTKFSYPAKRREVGCSFYS